MSIASSLFLIAAGAILRFAVTADISGLDLQVVGLILLIVGIIGLAISVGFTVMQSSRRGEEDPYP